jgi:MFS family permease
VTDSTNLKWWQGVPRYAWLVLLIAALGWLFDAMDQNLFNMVRAPSVKELLGATQGLTGKALDDAAKLVGAQLTAVFLIGWAIGGFVFGMIGDRLGRTRTMMLTILIYALFTGLNGLVKDLPQYFICRFITALGVGGEFAAGAALVAEVWPARSRPMALGTLQALSAVGNMGAAVINLLAGADWRIVYFVGAAPALLVLWIRSSVKEPDAWHEAKERQSKDGGEMGNLAALFSDPTLRKNTIAGTLIALAGVGGLWGVGFFLPDLIRTVLGPGVATLDADAARKQLGSWVSIAFLFQNVGAFLGMFGYAALSERVGRKPALGLFLLLAYGSIQLAFWGVRDLSTAYGLSFVLGFCALAPFSAFAVYFPELYPTRLRATGVGFCYNCARLLAAAAPFALGGLAKTFNSATDPAYGFRIAAAIVASIYVVGFLGLALGPETKGKPLPE